MSAAGGAGASSAFVNPWTDTAAQKAMFQKTVRVALKMYLSPNRDKPRLLKEGVKYASGLKPFAGGKAYLYAPDIDTAGTTWVPPGFPGEYWTNYVAIPWGTAAVDQCWPEAVSNALQCPVIWPFAIARYQFPESAWDALKVARGFLTLLLAGRAHSVIGKSCNTRVYDAYSDAALTRIARSYHDLDPEKAPSAKDIDSIIETRDLENFLFLPNAPALAAARVLPTGGASPDYKEELPGTNPYWLASNVFWDEFYRLQKAKGIDAMNLTLARQRALLSDAGIGVEDPSTYGKYEDDYTEILLLREFGKMFYRRVRPANKRLETAHERFYLSSWPFSPIVVVYKWTDKFSKATASHAVAITEGVVLDVQSRHRKLFMPDAGSHAGIQLALDNDTISFVDNAKIDASWKHLEKEIVRALVTPAHFATRDIEILYAYAFQ